MAGIVIKSFGGISPKVPARYLQDTQAQVAVNCPVFNGPLQPLFGLGGPYVTLAPLTPPQTIYRFGQDTISNTSYWFSWATDVDVCRSQIASDANEWTFYTGDGAPKATYSALALTGSSYPAASRPLGVAPPTTKPTCRVIDDPLDATASAETRVYVYTNVSTEAGFSRESAPSPAGDSIDIRPGEHVRLTGFSAPVAGYLITHRRIYRAGGGGVYLFVAEIPVSTSTYDDAIAAEDLGEELPSLTWEEPPAALKGLTNLPNGIMAGFVGRDLYMCDPFHPYAWPTAYMQTVDYPIVGLGRMDTTLAVLTTGVPYFVQGTHPDNMAVVKSDVEQACASKRSIASAGGAVIYASPDGLVMLTPGGSNILTSTYFTRQQWQSYFKPESIHGYLHDNKYVAFYDTGVTQGGFIYDLISGQFVLHDIYATAGYSDLVVDKLFVAKSDCTVSSWADGSVTAYTWRSKKFTLPRVTMFSCAQLEAEAYPVTLKFYLDGAGSPGLTKTVTSRAPFRLPAAFSARDWELQVEGNSEVYSIAVAQAVGDLDGV